MSHASAPSSASFGPTHPNTSWTGSNSLAEFILRESQARAPRLPTLNLPKLPALPKEALRVVGGAAVLGAVTGGALAAVRKYQAMKQGELDGLAYAGAIGSAAAEVGAGCAGRSAAMLAVKSGASAIAQRAGAEGLKRLVGSHVGTLAALALVEQSLDTMHLTRGTLSRAEYGARSVTNVSALGGGYGGAVAGAALGSALPVVGTAVGALVGGMLGALGAGVVARSVTDSLRGIPADTSRT